MENILKNKGVQRLDAAMMKILIDHAAETIERLFKRPACIAICDENGELLGFLRMDGGPLRSIQISQCKAYTAARVQGSTKDLFLRLQREKEDIRFFCDPKFTAFPGGNLIKNRDNRIIGAVGISGLAPSEDHEVTESVAEFAKNW
jgi:glc operon protein GlcG